MASFTCEFCEKVFAHNRSLRRHIRLNHEGPSSSFKCTTCNKYFSTRAEWHRHSHSNINEDVNNKEINIYCEFCKKNISKTNWSYHKRTNEHKINSAVKIDNELNEDNEIKCIKSSFNNRIISYLIENENESELIPENFLNTIREKVIRLLCNHTQKHGTIKFNMELFADYILIKEDEDACMIDVKSHQTKMRIIEMYSTRDNILKIYNEQCDVIVKKMSEFQERDSGWALIEILRLEVNINQYKCIKGSQYIPLPRSIQRKFACINVQNNDEYCFKWALVSALNPVNTHSDRYTSYQVENIEDEVIVLENGIVLNFKNLDSPLPINQIRVFEINNPQISVNVFGLDEDDNIVGPYYFTQEEKVMHINLLLIENDSQLHYVWIKNISR